MNYLKILNKDIYYLQKNIELLKEQLQYLSINNNAIISLVPKSTFNADKLEKYITKKNKLENDLLFLIELYTGRIEKILTIIHNIDDEEVKLILTLKYIKNYSWQDIARTLSKNGRYINKDAPRKKIIRYFKQCPKMSVLNNI